MRSMLVIGYWREISAAWLQRWLSTLPSIITRVRWVKGVR